jgi:hypothetical protein
LPSQYNKLSRPIIINKEEEWEVEEFLAFKIHYKKVYYWVKWLDQSPDYTFYRAGNFKYSPHLMKQFHEKNPTQASPPQSLEHWIQLYNAGEDKYEDENDKLPVDKSVEASPTQHGLPKKV